VDDGMDCRTCTGRERGVPFGLSGEQPQAV